MFCFLIRNDCLFLLNCYSIKSISLIDCRILLESACSNALSNENSVNVSLFFKCSIMFILYFFLFVYSNKNVS